ncbi:DUF2771 domain-containing protein [Streptomyces sp. NPDC048442]|uniref:DUF2771 domain-containing protein n=1 Tax=Streptomyces sp. NPDC048442 TaxID=3154823 RepID=UPI0034254904
MTVALFSGKARRTAAALGVVSAGLLVLSACDKPTPRATLTVGSESVNSEAACYAHGDAGISEKETPGCLNKKPAKSIKVSMEDKVRLGVDPEVAENGWTVFINGQPAEQEPFKKTYRSIPGNAFFTSGQQGAPPAKEATVSIVETGGKKLIGVWSFKLEKDS